MFLLAHMNKRLIFSRAFLTGGIAALLPSILLAGPYEPRPVAPEPAPPMSAPAGRSRIGIGANMGFGIKAKFISEAFTSTGVVVDPDPIPQDVYVDRGGVSDKDDQAEGGEIFYELLLSESPELSWGLHLSGGYNNLEFGATNPLEAFSTGDGSFVGMGSARQELKADLWHLNLGFFTESHITDRFSAKFGVGGSAGYIRSKYSMSGPFDLVGESKRDDEILYGGYAEATLGYDITPDWTIFGGLRYQYFNSFETKSASSGADVDFGGSFVGSVGMRWSF